MKLVASLFAVAQCARVHDDLDESVLAAGESQGKCGAAYMPAGLACCDGLTLYPPGETKCCYTGTGLLGVRGVPCAMLSETSASDESLEEHAVQTQGMCGAVAVPKGLACCDGLTLYPPGQTSCCWTGTGLLTANGVKCAMLAEESAVAETSVESQGKCGAAYMPPGLRCCDGLTLYPPGETKCCYTGTGLLGVNGVPCAMLSETSASEESLDEHAVQTQGMCGAVAVPKGLACCDGLTLYPPGQTSCCYTGTGLLTAKGIKCAMLAEEGAVAETETDVDLEGNMTVLHETNVWCGGGAFKSCNLPAPGIGSCCCGKTCSCGAAPSCCGKQCGAPPPSPHRRRWTPTPSPGGTCGAASLPAGMKCCDNLVVYEPKWNKCCWKGTGQVDAVGGSCFR